MWTRSWLCFPAGVAPENSLSPGQIGNQRPCSDPRGNFCVTTLNKEQMEALDYGVHHVSDDQKFLIMGNGARAFAVAANAKNLERPSIRSRLENARQECAK